MKRIITVVALVLTVAWGGFVFSNSLDSGPESSEKSGKVYEVVNEVAQSLGATHEIPEATIRTSAHFGEFAVLALLITVDLTLLLDLRLSEPLSHRHALVLLSVPFSALMAVIDECIQFFSPGRAMQLLDIMIDVGGALCGVLGIALIFFLIRAVRVRSTKPQPI